MSVSERINDSIKLGAVHGALYTDPAIFDEEMTRIFERSWVFVGHDSEIPQVGSYVRRRMGRREVLLVRSKSGPEVLINRCAHRGNLLCQEDSGRRRSLVCQYHGWVFDLNGKLVNVPFGAEGAHDSKCLNLSKARMDSYRGFVFATLAEDAVSLEAYLGNARSALDRAARLSPAGELDLCGGWGRHITYGNWKMLAENDTDGYHVNYVHNSFARAVEVQYKYENVLLQQEDELEPESRALGGGHAELDYAPTYAKPLIWLGVEPNRYPEYTRRMEEAYGQEEALRILTAGPPHTYIFPNLFIAETMVTMIEPVSAGESITWHTPLYLKDAPEEVNRRILRQGEAAVGPSAFLLADDATTSERQWRALHASPGWLDMSRGLSREQDAGGGIKVSHYTDETPQRAFWDHYKQLMLTEKAAV